MSDSDIIDAAFFTTRRTHVRVTVLAWYDEIERAKDYRPLVCVVHKIPWNGAVKQAKNMQRLQQGLERLVASRLVIARYG